jgi:hypothetical protein
MHRKHRFDSLQFNHHGILDKKVEAVRAAKGSVLVGQLNWLFRNET